MRYWPDQNVAEHENITHFRQACANLGLGLVELSEDGLRFDTGARLRPGDCDLVLNLHFAAPKCYDAPSVAPLWNPLDFYSSFGLVQSLANQFSHDYYASTGSQVTDQLLADLRPDYRAPKLLLNHGLPGPLTDPPLRDRLKFFYVGINWERVSGHPGRHDELLRGLDAANAVDVYGPAELAGGVRPWEGFDGYRGSLPFDGRSVVGAARSSGLCLVLSSAAHLRDGIMSNRLFEAVAAGCVVVADRHPFVVEKLGDLAYYIDAEAPVQQTVEALLTLKQELESDPLGTQERARATQRAIAPDLLLDVQLDLLVRLVAEAEAKAPLVHLSVACVVLPSEQMDAQAFNEWLHTSAGLDSVSRVVVITANDELASLVQRLASAGPRDYDVVRVPTGTHHESRALFQALEGWTAQAKEDWIFFATGNEVVQSDFVKQTQAFASDERQVVHHASVRHAGRRSVEQAGGSPVLTVPAEGEFWGRALSSFALRREILQTWLRSAAGSHGLFALLLALDAELNEDRSQSAYAVVPVPTVLVPRRAGTGPEVMGDLWTGSSSDALGGVFLRKAGHSVEGDGGAQGSISAAVQAGARYMRVQKIAHAASAAQTAVPAPAPPAQTMTAQQVLERVESMDEAQRQYVLKLLLDAVPTSTWRRVWLKLVRSRKALAGP